MTQSRLLSLAACGLLAATAHAQYAAPRLDSTSAPASNWAVEAGVGYLAATSVDGADNGWVGHVAGFYLDPLDATRETTLKYGVEFLHGDASGTIAGLDTTLETNMAFVDLGVDYRFARHFGVGLTGGVGMGGLKGKVGPFSDTTTAFGYQLRPEVAAYVNEHVGVFLAYRFVHSFPLDNNWSGNWNNPVQHAIEFGVKVRF